MGIAESTGQYLYNSVTELEAVDDHLYIWHVEVVLFLNPVPVLVTFRPDLTRQ